MTTEQTLANSLGIELAIKQIPIGAHKINYLVAGKGEPLLLIHGANFGWGVWYPNIPELAKHFTVYAIDLPGAGHSSTIDYGKLDVTRDFVEITKEFIQRQDLRDLAILGHSIGGFVALKVTLEQSQSIKNVILVDSTGFSSKINFKADSRQ